MKRKHQRKLKKLIRAIVISARSEQVSTLLDTLEESKKLATEIPEPEQEEYEEFFTKVMTQELNLLTIDVRKLTLNYEELLFKTKQQAAKFQERLADKSLDQSMREFYHKEFLNILKPKYILDQVIENYKEFLEVLKIIKDEFNDWFFLGRIDFIKQLLQPHIVLDTQNSTEIWLYKKNENALTPERNEEMYKEASKKQGQPGAQKKEEPTGKKPSEGGKTDEDIVDADYKVEDEDKGK